MDFCNFSFLLNSFDSAPSILMIMSKCRMSPINYFDVWWIFDWLLSVFAVPYFHYWHSHDKTNLLEKALGNRHFNSCIRPQLGPLRMEMCKSDKRQLQPIAPHCTLPGKKIQGDSRQLSFAQLMRFQKFIGVIDGSWKISINKNEIRTKLNVLAALAYVNKPNLGYMSTSPGFPLFIYIWHQVTYRNHD